MTKTKPTLTQEDGQPFYGGRRPRLSKNNEKGKRIK